VPGFEFDDSDLQLKNTGDDMDDDQTSAGPDGNDNRKGQMPEYNDLEKLLHAVQNSNRMTRTLVGHGRALILILLCIAFLLFLSFVKFG
jgi:hypothetical protein